jgi:ubiquinone/menaquinone biosynthesis C-methylase UbiE
MDVKDYYRNVERYDWITDIKYPEKLYHLSRERSLVKLIHHYENINGTTLDLGCGTGMITRHLEGLITAVDINPWNIQQAKKHLNDFVINFGVGDAEDLTYPDNTFNTVLCTDVLEHVEQVQVVTHHIQRVLRKGGFLIGSVPSRSIVWKYRHLLSSSCPASEPFHHSYSKLGVQLLLRQFKIVRIRLGAFGLEWFFVARKI